jgi:hypothetical protein
MHHACHDGIMHALGVQPLKQLLLLRRVRRQVQLYTSVLAALLPQCCCCLKSGRTRSTDFKQLLCCLSHSLLLLLWQVLLYASVLAALLPQCCC